MVGNDHVHGPSRLNQIIIRSDSAMIGMQV